MQTLVITDEAHKALKIKCAESGKPMRELSSNIILHTLDRLDSKKVSMGTIYKAETIDR